MKKLIFIFLMLLCTLGFQQSRAFTTYYYPTSATVSGGGTTVCQGGTASPLTCTVPTSGYTSFFGGGPSVLVTYTWYYNTTGSVVSGTPVTGYTGLTYTAGAGSAILTLPASAISTATVGVFYYYVILTGTNTADGSYSPIYITSNTQTITVTAPTSSISGPATLCSGASATYTDATTGGTWSGGSPGIATISSGGVVTGAGSGGVATISYSVSGGCTSTDVITVNPTPAGISGTLVVCAGNSTSLTDATGAGSWTSSNPGIATVGSSTGVVSGSAAGTSSVVFTLTSTGCTTSSVVTVNPAASPITGTQWVCAGQNTTLADATPGGTWSSSAPGTASVSGGVVTGVAAGVATISYTLATGCSATALVTVNPLPSIITGSTTVCNTYTTTLADAGGALGTWSSGDPSVASVGSTTGVVTGASVGATTITYSYTATGCYVTQSETVNPLPAAILGPDSLCANATTTVTDVTAGGTWTSGTPASAGVAGATGIVTGASAGSTIITYALATGCYVTRTETVLPYPAPITGDSMVCSGSTITEADITGGSSWSITGTGATIGAANGVITASLPGTFPVVNTVWYTITATGCKVSRPVTINPLPGTIVGVMLICDSSTTNLSNSLPGGIWTSAAPSTATINATTGVAYGIAPGTDNITYTIPTTGCMATGTLTVAPPPAPITGVETVCPMLTTTLSDGITSGTWTSGTTSVATVDPFSGVITGVSPGTSIITYELGVCATTVEITVNSLPGVIAGPDFVCTNGSTITLTDPTTGGSWTSGDAAVAPVGSTSGVVTGLSTGTTVITYKLAITGCYQTLQVTVEPLPASIAGQDSVCLGYSTLLTDPVSGGVFSSGNPTIASVGSGSGTITGVSAGSTQITYTLSGTGCQIAVPFHVNPILSVSTTISISPGDTICAGNPVTFSAASVNSGSGPVYTWYVNGIAVTGATSSAYTFNPTNGQVVKCVLTSNATCAIPNTATSNNIMMTVNPVTNPTVTMYPNSRDTLCVGAVQTYSITSTSGGSAPVYLWTVNWMPVATGVLSYTYTPSTGDIIRCGMISSSPCPIPDTAFAVDTVIVLPYNTPSVSLAATGVLSICQGNPATLTASAVAGGWGPSFAWTVNGNPVANTSDTYTYMPSNNDLVKVVMTSNYPCILASANVSDEVTIDVTPLITVTITDTRNGLLAQGQYDTLVAHVLNGGTDPLYQWYRNGSPLVGANYYELAKNDFANGDSVSCQVITNGSNGCDGIGAHAWKLLEVAPVGVTEINAQITNIRLTPNPNIGLFRLTGGVGDASVFVFVRINDMVGHTIWQATVPVVNNKIDVSVRLDETLGSGNYMLQLTSDSGTNTQGFIVTK